MFTAEYLELKRIVGDRRIAMDQASLRLPCVANRWQAPLSGPRTTAGHWAHECRPEP